MRLRKMVGLAALAAGSVTGVGGGAAVAASSRDAPATVTRFHLGPSIARGTVSVEPMDPGQARDPAFGRIAAAVEAQLQAQGWTIARGGPSEQVALVRVVQTAREEVRRRGGISFGFGFGGGSWGRHGGVGLGGGATVPVTGGTRRDQVVNSELSVRLQRRSDGTAIWEGRAQDEVRAQGPAADPDAAAVRLAPLLFRGFPGESGRTIRVR